MLTGIFGRKRSGKTTLGKGLSLDAWQSEQRRSLVFDFKGSDWGGHSVVFLTLEPFLASYAKSRNCEVFFDDAGLSINRNRDLMQFFTMAESDGRSTTVIGHSGADLLPGMRAQFDRVYFFRQPFEVLEKWYEIFHDKRIYWAAELDPFEFLDMDLYRDPLIRRLKL